MILTRTHRSAILLVFSALSQFIAVSFASGLPQISVCLRHTVWSAYDRRGWLRPAGLCFLTWLRKDSRELEVGIDLVGLPANVETEVQQDSFSAEEFPQYQETHFVSMFTDGQTGGVP